MIMQCCVGDSEIDAYVVEERRVGKHHAAACKIGGGAENQRVAADAESLALQQRRGAAAVKIRGERAQRFAIGTAQAPVDACGRHAVRRVQNMSGQFPHCARNLPS